MKSLYVIATFKSLRHEGQAREILIGVDDPIRLRRFTEEKITEIERDGLTFKAIEELYAEFDKYYPAEKFLPIEYVHGDSEHITVRWTGDASNAVTTFCLRTIFD